MAGKIQLTPAELLAQSAEMLALEQEFASLFQKTESLLGQVNSDWSANLANNFAGKISSAQKACSSIIHMLDGGARIAETSANTMDSVDQLLKKAVTGENDGTSGDSRVIYGPGKESISKTNGFNWENQIQEWSKKIVTGDRTRIWDKKEETEKVEWDLGFKLKEKVEEPEDIYKKTKYITGKEGDTTYYKKEATFFEVKKEKSVSASIIDDRWSNEHASAYATIGKAEAHASLSGGFYSYTADGKRIFSPGIKAEIGTSVTAIEMGAQGQIGNDMAGVTFKGDVAAGKVEAKGSFEIGAWDKNRSPQMNLEAKMEAIAVEAKGSVKANILGGGAEAKVGVNVGIGAHAEVSMKDGIFKCDIGASVGLGVTAEVEFDVGGMVDTAVENAEKIADFADKTVDAVSDAAEAAWDATEKAVDAVADAAKDAAKAAEKAAKKAAEKAEEALDDFGDWVGSWF